MGQEPARAAEERAAVVVTHRVVAAPEASKTILPEMERVAASVAWKMTLATRKTTILERKIKRQRGLRNPIAWLIAQTRPRVREATDVSNNTKPTIHKDGARRSLNGEQTFI